MKIKINEKEAYEINCPDVIEGEEFIAFKSRIDFIAKIVGQDPFRVLITRKDKKDKPWFKDRNFAIEMIKLYYKASSIEKEKIMEEHNISLSTFKNDIVELKKVWNIKPNEVGLVEFPTAGQKVNFIDNNGTKTEETNQKESE